MMKPKVLTKVPVRFQATVVDWMGARRGCSLKLSTGHFVGFNGLDMSWRAQTLNLYGQLPERRTPITDILDMMIKMRFVYDFEQLVEEHEDMSRMARVRFARKAK